MLISLVVAISKNNAIGKNNQLLWHLPNDLKFFKKITSNHCIIMGRKTFESIGKPLPNRTNIVISRTKLEVDGVLFFDSVEKALNYCKSQNQEEVFIIGGGEIYKSTLPLAHKIFLTEVDVEIEADVYFPLIKNQDWNKNLLESYRKDEKHLYDFDIYELTRKL